MTNSNSSLLTSQEKAICEQVSITNQAPHNKRAQVLLAVNEGLSQVTTAQRVGLSIGQVRYCMQRFRQMRCDIFPAELRVQQDMIPQVKSETKPTSDKVKKQKKNKKSKDKKAKTKKSKDKKSKDKKGKDKKKKSAQKVKKQKKGKSKNKEAKNKKENKKPSKKSKIKKAKKKNS